MTQTALVIGGTGPTGPSIVMGLVSRGYATTVLHRGRHEDASLPAELEHVHADPFDGDSFAKGVRGRTFDVVVSAYGRLRMIGEVLTGKVGRIVAIGGIPVYQGWFAPTRNVPEGFPVPIPHTFPHATSSEDGEYPYRVARAEAEFLDRVAEDAFSGCVMRYPLIYGPRQVVPREWSIVRRILDGRRSFLVPDAGLALFSRGYSLNMAHAVLLAVDDPAVVHGRGFDCADEDCLSNAQVIRVIARALEVEVELVTSPFLPGHPSSALVGAQNDHRVVDTAGITRDLGYCDLVPAIEALGVTARWYRDHPLECGGEQERTLGDPFDYVMEDTVIARTRRYHDELQSVFGSGGLFASAYDDHPPRT